MKDLSHQSNKLYRTYHHQNIEEEQFQTTLLQIESTVNDRPLTYIDNDDEIQPLKPNDFLSTNFECPDIMPTASSNDSIPRETIIAMKKQANEILNVFWKKWSTTYLQELRERHSRNDPKFRKSTAQNPPRIDDIVIIHDPLRNRSTWKIGKIVQLHKSACDEIIRSASIQLGNRKDLTKRPLQVITRPLQAIYPLEINKEDERKIAIISSNHDKPEQENFDIDSIEVEVIESSDEDEI